MIRRVQRRPQRLGWPLILLGFSLAVAAQVSFDVTAIVAEVRPALVTISGKSPGGVPSIGSGFVVSREGTIVTNLHVIRNLTSAEVQFVNGGLAKSVSVLAFHEQRDLAVIRVPRSDLRTLELGDATDVQIGEPVILMGSPKGLQGSVTTGVVSAVRESPFGFELIQTDAASNPGSSGGPLINSKGQVIAVLNSKLKSAENVSFAVPINYVVELLDAVRQPMSLAEMRRRLGNRPISIPIKPSTTPKLWKSLVSGNRFSFRISDDYIYAEAVLPEDRKRLGDNLSLEWQKEDGKFIGKSRMLFTCIYQNWADQPKYNRCFVENPTELTSVTSSRIEGRTFSAPPGAKFDCKKCKYKKKPKWWPVVWVRE